MVVAGRMGFDANALKRVVHVPIVVYDVVCAVNIGCADHARIPVASLPTEGSSNFITDSEVAPPTVFFFCFCFLFSFL